MMIDNDRPGDEYAEKKYISSYNFPCLKIIVCQVWREIAAQLFWLIDTAFRKKIVTKGGSMKGILSDYCASSDFL